MTTGQIVITFTPVVYNVRVNAVEIVAGTPPAPTVSSLTPASGNAGTSLPVTFTGTNLGIDVVINAPAALTVNNIKVVSATQVTATVNIPSGTTTGAYNLSLTTSGGTTAPFTFSVQ